MAENYGGVLDDRMRDIFDLLRAAPLENVTSILDVGAGRGELAVHLAKQGKKVTCTGVSIGSYVRDIGELRDKYGIEYAECDVENMPFPQASFDAVILSHVLEHCPNVASALAHVRRVLREDGLLLVFVPPPEVTVCAGHVSVGWNLGQLMYVLLLNGFDVKNGNFIEYGYNVCAFVRKSSRPLPQLRHDKGDISLLAKEGFFPLPVGGDHFDGSIKAVNWPDPSKCARGDLKRRPFKRLLSLILPLGAKIWLARKLSKLTKFLVRTAPGNSTELR
ncbi:MAG: class I SAM-dependent methyltransferase [Nitrospinae bacterium]|nr:class I SAM-dependent methyltransferase [Nitrospinota bacterium]